MTDITGTDSGETLAGTEGDDTIAALGGNDTITVTQGHDTVDGGLGFDTLGSSLTLPWLAAGPRDYLVTADHLSDGSGMLDTAFSGIELVQLFDLSGYDATVAGAAFSGALSVLVGAGSHALTGGNGDDLFAFSAEGTGGGSSVVDGGGGSDRLGFVVGAGRSATLAHSGNLFTFDAGTARTVAAQNVEAVTAHLFGGTLDASSSDVPIAFSTFGVSTAIGGSGADTFSPVVGGGATFTGLGGADRFVFSATSPLFQTMAGATILDLAAEDLIDLSGNGRIFVGNGALAGIDSYRTFTFAGKTYLEGGDGAALLTIANGAFVLAETAPGSNVLQVAAIAPGPSGADDVILGTDGADILEGGGGSDSIDGIGGDDLIDGGSGTDDLEGGAGNDTIFGGTGNDVILGGEGFDTVRGGDGKDYLAGTGFEGDWMMGGRGDDMLIASGGIWYLYGGDDPDAGWDGGWNLHFGGEDLSAEDDGNDFISLSNGVYSAIDGGSGDDWIITDFGSDILIAGGTGNDIVLVGASQRVFADGGAGNDSLRYNAANAPQASLIVFDGGAGDDTLYYAQSNGSTLEEGMLLGGDGFDRIESQTWAAGGYVEIDAGADADLVQITRYRTDYDIALGSGADTLLVDVEYHLGFTSGVEIAVTGFTAGDDGDALNLVTYLARRLAGWSFAENPFGAGFLRLEQRGADAALQIDIDGAAGGYGFEDLLVLAGVSASALTSRNLGGFAPGGGPDAALTIAGAFTTADMINGASGGDHLLGYGGNDGLFGAAGDDLLEGGTGDDILDGQFGDDTLHGGDGDDVLSDEFDGSDILYGGEGNDSLFVDRQWFVLPDQQLVLDGGAGNDQLTFMSAPGRHDATLLGGAGNDSFLIYLGREVTVDAGEGNDTVTFDIAAGATITLGSGADALQPTLQLAPTAPVSPTVTDFEAGAAGDRFYLFGIVQALAPSWNADTNPFEGNFVRLRTDGADTLLVYNTDGAGIDYEVLVRLTGVDTGELTAFNFGYAFGAVLTIGTANADALVGTAIADELLGLGEADDLSGLAGEDRLDGGLGDDSLDGGRGFDTAVFSGNAASYAWSLVAGETAISGPDGSDTLVRVERMEFADAAYELRSAFGPATHALVGFGAGTAAGGWSDSDLNPRTLADLNGDGRPDIVGFGAAGVYVSLAAPGGGFAAPFLATVGFGSSVGSGGWSSQEAMPRAFADIDGDGIADLVGFGADGVYASLGVGDGTFGAAFHAAVGFGSSAASGGWSDSDGAPRHLADLDGDGRADILGFGAGGTYVALANADGTFAAPFLASPGYGSGAGSGGWSSDATSPRVLADVDGDGHADIVGFAPAGVYVSLGTGSGAFAAPFLATVAFGSGAGSGGWSDTGTHPRLLADLDGDGRDDIVGFGAGGTYVALARPGGSFAAPFLASAGFGSSAGAGGWSSMAAMPRLLADVNGDGHPDVVGFGIEGTYAAYGDGTGGFGAPFLATVGFGSSAGSGGWSDAELYPRMVADLNGDGTADILGFGEGGIYTSPVVSDWVLV